MLNQCYATYNLVRLIYISLADIIDTVKVAAEGVKSHSYSIATWMRNNVSPALRDIPPATPGPSPQDPQPSTSAGVWAGMPVRMLSLGC